VKLSHIVGNILTTQKILHGSANSVLYKIVHCITHNQEKWQYVYGVSYPNLSP
jgi:hypothetical protein